MKKLGLIVFVGFTLSGSWQAAMAQMDSVSAQPNKLNNPPSTTKGIGGKMSEETHERAQKTDKIQKTDKEWQAQLTPMQYEVTRKKGTERAFANEFYNNHKKGTYYCVCCGAELFDSNQKYDSGSGWPSWWAPINHNAVGTETDKSLWMSRTEVHCQKCAAHLGHIFDDGPAPTGQRYCINSAALKFEEKK